MPAAARIQLLRILGRCDPRRLSPIYSKRSSPRPPSSGALPIVRVPLRLRAARGVRRILQSQRAEFHIGAGDAERPSSTHVIIEQNIMSTSEGPAAKMYYDRLAGRNSAGPRIQAPGKNFVANHDQGRERQPDRKLHERRAMVSQDTR
ncbi:hypothetical protein KM043_005564 [Ampulex compressa]|nr:hypothetical protein KM043_005564 [Ampulex compressa]